MASGHGNIVPYNITLFFILHNTESILSWWWWFKSTNPYVNIKFVLTTFKRDFFIILQLLVFSKTEFVKMG